MLKTAIIGLGNAGGQVAALAKERLGVDCLAINSSEMDLSTLPQSICKFTIGKEKGSGKDRVEAKSYVKEKIMEIISDESLMKLMDSDLVFILSSTGGGTGSGTAPVLASILKKSFVDVEFVVGGILPTLSEALTTQTNTLEYIKEIYSMDGLNYMLYDNERAKSLPSNKMMETINKNIVDDIEVLMGTFQMATKYQSIDEKESLNLISTPGRIAIGSARDIKEKDLDITSIEGMIINDIKSNCHVELARDFKVNRIGVISNLSDKLNGTFDKEGIPVIKGLVGEPIEGFLHEYVNPDKNLTNNAFVVLTGLTKVNDRIRSINDRIEEISKVQEIYEESDNEIASVDLKSLQSKRERKKTEVADEVDIDAIFGQFDM